MLNLNNAELSSSPFNWFVVDNVIDEDLFHEAREEVKTIFDNIKKIDVAYVDHCEYFDSNFPPGESNIIGGLSNTKTDPAEIVLNVTKNGGALERLCKEFLKKNQQNNLYRLLVPFSIFDLKSICPVKIHLKNEEMSIFDYIFFKNCYVNLKLSSYTSNFGIHQHKDHENKVTALLFYFGFSDKIQRNGCSTQIYEVTKGNENWSKKETPPTLDYQDDQKLNLVKEVNCLPNRLFGFRKTRDSWHGVDYHQLPSGVRREALQINLMKHYKSSVNLRRLLTVINHIKSFFRPIVKKYLISKKTH